MMINASQEENNNLSHKTTTTTSGAPRRWFHWVILCLCFAAVDFFIRSSPSINSNPVQSCSCPEKHNVKTNSDHHEKEISSESSPAPTPLPELQKYVAQINARKSQQPKLWSFPGKSEKYDMNKYYFKFDPQNPKCPELPLKPDENPTNCPDEDMYLALWMLIRDHRRPENQGRPLTLVDVGSNKGYSIAAMLETLNLTVPERSSDITDIHYVDPTLLPNNNNTASSSSSQLTNFDFPGFFSREAVVLDAYAYAEKLNNLPPAWRPALPGGCCDGAAKSPFHPNHRLAKHPWLVPSWIAGGRRRGNVHVPEVEAFLIDGTRGHVEYVTQFFNKENARYETEVRGKYNRSIASITKNQPAVPSPPPTKLSFHYFQRAMSNKNGMTKFCDPPFGAEIGAICDKGIATPITTLDRLIPSHVQKIDILLTDTEGHDFDVLEGARERWLKDGKVGIYVFETHRGPNKRPLSSIIGELEGYGYACYIPVRSKTKNLTMSRHVVRVSPMELCWKGDYDTKLLRGWKNMMCAHETNFPELKFVFEELSNLEKEYELHTCPVDERIFQAHPWRNFSWGMKNK